MLNHWPIAAVLKSVLPTYRAGPCNLRELVREPTSVFARSGFMHDVSALVFLPLLLDRPFVFIVFSTGRILLHNYAFPALIALRLVVALIAFLPNDRFLFPMGLLLMPMLLLVRLLMS